MFLNKFIYFALYQKHLLKVSTSCLSKDGDNIINYNLNDKSFYTKKNREDIMNETTIKKPDPQFAQDILKQKVNHKKEPRFILL